MAEQVTQVLGIVGIKNMGEYNSQTMYEKLNVVTYQGSSYCALKSSIGVSPTDTEYWQLYAEKGEKGDTGEQGPKPVKGVDYYTAADRAEFSLDIKSDVHDEVSEQVGNITNGKPLVANSVSGMTDTTRIYVNTSDGYVYYYDGSDWVQGWLYQATEITDHSINKTKNNYFKRSTKQLFNKDTAIPNKFVARDTGNIYTPSNPDHEFWASDFIEITEDYPLVFPYGYTSSAQYAWYDANKDYISGGVNANYVPIIKPANAVYFRTTVVDNLDNFSVSYGGYPFNNEDYYVLNDNDTKYLSKNFIEKELNSEVILKKDEILVGWYCDGTGRYNRVTRPEYYYGLSNFIPLEYGEYISANHNFSFVCEYDENFQFLGWDSVSAKNTFTPLYEDCKHIRIELLVSDIDDISFNYGNISPDAHIPEFFPKIENNSISLKMLNDTVKEFIQNSSSKILMNKKCVFMGDSITYGRSSGTRVENPYPKIISDLTGCISTNLGINGSTIAGDGQSTGGSGHILGYQPMNLRFDTITDDCDYIVIFGGTNDYGADRILPVGTIDDDTNLTFCGAIKSIINKFYTNYSTERRTKLCFITPIQRPTGDNPNEYGSRLIDYVNAMITVCNKYSIPVLDLYHNAQCYPLNTTFRQVNMADGLHPTQNYYYTLADKIKNFMETL